MSEMSNEKGNMVLPEFQNLEQIFRTLVDKAVTSGNPNMGSFLIRDDLAGIMIVGKMPEIMMLSRILSTIGKSPLVKMPGH